MHLPQKMSVFGLLLAGPSRDLVPSAQKQTSIFSDIKALITQFVSHTVDITPMPYTSDSYLI